VFFIFYVNVIISNNGQFLEEMLEQLVKYCHKVLQNHYQNHKLLSVFSQLFSTLASFVIPARASSERNGLYTPFPL